MRMGSGLRGILDTFTCWRLLPVFFYRSYNIRIIELSMNQTIEVVYEDNVLKPLEPIEGIKEHERVIAYLTRRPVKKGLHKLVGTLAHKEAKAMQKLIDEEFEKIEGEW